MVRFDLNKIKFKLMKKIILIIIAIGFIIAACQKEYESGATKASQFAGEWYYQLRFPDGTIKYDFDDTYPNTSDGIAFLTFNSAANKANEVWFDDREWNFPLKAKFTLTGQPSNFSADMAVNEYVLANSFDPNDVNDTDMVDGKEIVVTLNAGDDYSIAEIIEAKILLNAATVAADENKTRTDSIYAKFAFHGADFHYTVKRNIKTVLVPPVIPTIPVADSTTFDTTFVYIRDVDFFDVLDPSDTFIITGHRSTGWEIYY